MDSGASIDNLVNKEKDKVEKTGSKCVAAAAAFVKVSMDGVPYLHKEDLKMYKSYKELSTALYKLFSSLNMGQHGSAILVTRIVCLKKLMGGIS